MGLVSILEDIEKRRAGLDAVLSAPESDASLLHSKLVASGLLEQCERLLKAARDARDPELDLAVALQKAHVEIEQLRQSQARLIAERDSLASRPRPGEDNQIARQKEANTRLREEVRSLRERIKLLHQRVRDENRWAAAARLWAGIPPRQPKPRRK